MRLSLYIERSHDVGILWSAIIIYKSGVSQQVWQDGFILAVPLVWQSCNNSSVDPIHNIDIATSIFIHSIVCGFPKLDKLEMKLFYQ